MRSSPAVSLLTLLVFGPFSTAQVSWTERAPATSPSARGAAAMAYDVARREVVLFGGFDDVSMSCCTLGDTWTWDGSSWTQRSPSTSPTPRLGAMMAYDSAREVVVMFGGSTTSTVFDETWEWDGVDWIARTPATHPTARTTGAMVYDSAHGEVVLFGGGNQSNSFDDTWVWDGIDWTQRAPVVRPGARRLHSMAYDRASREVLLYGGATDTLFPIDETWTWDGSNWTLEQPSVSPGGLFGGAMAYDVDRGRTVFFVGALFGPSLSFTWEWSGSDWAQRVPFVTPAPAERFLPSVVYDGARRNVVMFGGLRSLPGVGAGSLGDTWVYGERLADYRLVGSGCLGSGGIPTLQAVGLPWLGTTFDLVVDSLPVGPSVPTILAFDFETNRPPVPLDVIGMNGCTLFASPLLNVVLAASGGGVTLALPLSMDPILLGLRFSNQAFVVDPGATPLGLTASNAGTATIGLR